MIRTGTSNKKVLSFILTLAMVISLVPMFCVEAFAATESGVQYIAADGTTQTCPSATVVEGTTDAVTWTDGWYVVTGATVTIENTVTVNGNVNLILADNSIVNVSASSSISYGKTLTVYSQTNGTGKLNITGTSDCALAMQGAALTVYGGSVSITGSGDNVYGAKGGAFGLGQIYVSGGTVEVKGGDSVKSVQDVWITVEKGKFTASVDESVEPIPSGAVNSWPPVSLKGGNDASTATPIPEIGVYKYIEITPAVASVTSGAAINFSNVKDAINYASATAIDDAKTVQLLVDVDLTEDITIPAGYAVKLDLNGHVLKGTGSGSVITNNGDLIIKDTADVTWNPHFFEYVSTGAWKLTTTTDPSAPTPDDIDMKTITDGDIVKVEGGCITGGDATKTPSCPDGGAIYNNGKDAALVLEGISIIGNTAHDGGGISNYLGTLTMSGVTVAGNGSLDSDSNNYDGGGIYNREGTAVISGSTIANNIATGYGGGVYNEEGTLEISTTTIIGNFAQGDSNGGGGGIYINNSKVTASGVTVSKNKTTESGGGIDNNSGTLSISDSTITENTAGMAGGLNNFNTVSMRNVLITTNSAASVGGVMNCGEANIEDCTIQGNIADSVCGGLFNFSEVQGQSVLSIKGSIVLNDNYLSQGGIKTHSNLILSNCDITTIGALADDTLIGVTKQVGAYPYFNATSGAISTTGSDYVEYFYADDSDNYVVIESGSGLALIKKVTKPYTVKHYQQNIADSGYALKDTDNTTGAALTSTAAVAKSYEGFTAQAFSQQKILEDGSTNVNIYYNRNIYTATFVAAGQTYITQQVKYGAKLDEPSAPSTQGFQFNGWYKESTFDTEWDFSTDTMPATNASIYAKLTSNAPAPVSYYESNSTTITVPVSGNKDTVKVQATVSGTNATVKDVTSDEITKVGTGSEVVIDLTGLSKSVTGVTIPKTTFENVASSDADGLEIKMPNGTTVIFDKEALAAVASQAKAKDIKLVIDKDTKAESTLTSAQKETIKEMNNAVVLDAYFVSGGERIHDFNGGEADIVAEYKTTKPIRVWYVAEDGTKTAVPCTFDGKTATFTVTHFSHYVVEVIDELEFEDVNASAYYYDAVAWAYANGITSGINATQFGPNIGTTRAHMVTFLWRAAGCPEPTTKTCAFTDVVAGSYYEKAVLWGVETGVVKGTSATTFSPDQIVTRCQAVTFLWRYEGAIPFTNMTANGPAPSPFTDVKTSAYYYNAVLWAKAQGITDGVSATAFAPDRKCTRAEVVTFLYRDIVK